MRPNWLSNRIFKSSTTSSTLLLRLEYAHRSAVENHVHCQPRLGSRRSLIVRVGIIYNTTRRLSVHSSSFASFPELVTPGGWWLPLPASASAVGDVSARQAIFLVAKIQMLRATATARERSIWGKRTRILIVASVSPDCRAAEGDATNLLVQIAPRRAADLHLLLQLLQRLDQCCESFCRHHGLGAGSAEKLRPQGSLPPPGTTSGAEDTT